ncbi:MAG: ATP-binding protein, partial [Gemmatimonadaceae bacterium]|nr:ATP-binding protein [Gemmatimonadaceae bacterium]
VTLDRSQEVLGGTIPPGSYCQLVVQDDGMGMSPEMVRMAFEPFFTTKGSGGTGLGLATVLAITTSVGGGIVVQSVPKAGSTFTILLPTARRASRDN